MTDLTPTPLGELATLQAGVGFPLELQGRTSGDYPLAKVGDISRVGRSGESTLFGADHYVDDEDLARLNAKPIPTGSILFSKIGEAIRHNHRVIAGCPLLIDNNAMAAIPNRRVESRFLYHFLRTVDFYTLASATTVPALRKSDLERLRVPLPFLPDQRRIAEILDKADALRAKRRAALAQLDTLIQSVFLDMFGDPVASGWDMTTVAGVAADANGAIRTGPFGSQLLHSEFTEEGISVLGIDNAVENEFRWGQRRFIGEAKYQQLSRYTVHPGDVLITIMGTCGRCAIVPDNVPTAINTKHLCCITLDRTKCLPVFLHAYFLRHPIARRYLAQTAKGAIMEGLNMGIIREMPIPLAPIELQEEFSARLDTATDVMTEQRRSDVELATLFASLQHRAFRGQL